MIPAQRAENNVPQAAAMTIKVAVELRIEAQGAELHLDLPDALLADLAVHAVQPVEAAQHS